MQPIHWVGLAGFIWTILVILVTRFFSVQRMEGKFARLPENDKGYMTNTEANLCRAERKEAESCIVRILRRIEKRMALGNIVMRDLIEATPDVPNDKIERYEKDLGISLMDRNFDIPDI